MTMRDLATMRATSSLPVTLQFWTWGEAVEVASRAANEVGLHDRVTVKREGDRWVVQYAARLHLMNAI